MPVASGPTHDEVQRAMRFFYPHPREGQQERYAGRTWQYESRGAYDHERECFIGNWFDVGERREAMEAARARFTSREAEFAMRGSQYAERAEDEMPTWDEFRRILGPGKVLVSQQPDGSYSGEFVNLTADDKRRIAQAMSGHVDVLREQAADLQANTDEVYVKEQSGRVRAIPAKKAEKFVRESGASVVRRDGRKHGRDKGVRHG